MQKSTNMLFQVKPQGEVQNDLRNSTTEMRVAVSETWKTCCACGYAAMIAMKNAEVEAANIIAGLAVNEGLCCHDSVGWAERVDVETFANKKPFACILKDRRFRIYSA